MDYVSDLRRRSYNQVFRKFFLQKVLDIVFLLNRPIICFHQEQIRKRDEVPRQHTDDVGYPRDSGPRGVVNVLADDQIGIEPRQTTRTLTSFWLE
jgi:hypothetical protein